ncbi:hypothetical protein V8G54_032423 [Vigna mungo]|uniref:Uncharacterized protein n=1 Tax=Vigna mungo TaxID=3915 RepID=A0AAQ3MLZ0_VIGMU
MHMVTLAHLNGQAIDEGGEGAQFAEGIDDGVRQELDEGVCADGERIEVVVGQAEEVDAEDVEADRVKVHEGDIESTEEDGVEVEAEMIEVDVRDVERTEADGVDVESERIEVDETDVQRTEATKVELEARSIEVDEADVDRTEPAEVEVQSDRIEAHDEGDRLDEVRDWSSSRESHDGEKDGEMDSEDGLVDINVQCDVSESCSDLEVEVEPFVPGSDSDMEEDEINDSSWFNNE